MRKGTGSGTQSGTAGRTTPRGQWLAAVVGTLALTASPLHAVAAEPAAPASPKAAAATTAPAATTAAAPVAAAPVASTSVPLRIDLGLFGGLDVFSDKSGLGNAADARDVPRNGALVGLHGGVVLFDGRVGLEAEVRNTFTSLGGGSGDVSVFGARGNALWYFLTDGPVQPFATLGAGVDVLLADKSPCGNKVPPPKGCVYVRSPDDDLAFLAGVGARVPITHRIALRATGRYVLGDGRPLTAEQKAAGKEVEPAHNFELAVGAVYGLGGRPEDGDGDGVPDDHDRCLDKAEDRDGFEDRDGCPDLDNDGDGIPDATDKCPNEAEDVDKFQDDDGCPDPDNDGDGIRDSADKCPNVAEDKDGVDDQDGCPDLDEDGDGLADDKDRCPKEKEDKDGFEDDDGCPDPDNDGDGIPDAADKCPNQPETKNNIEDHDGCPDQLGEAVGKLFGEPVEVEFKGAALQKSADALLEPLLELLLEQEGLRIGVAVAADDATPAAGKVAGQRAQALVNWLTERGIDAARIEAAAGPTAGKPAKPVKGVSKIPVSFKIL